MSYQSEQDRWRDTLIAFMADTLDHEARRSASGVGYVCGVQDALAVVCALAGIPLEEITSPALAIRQQRARDRAGDAPFA